MSNVEVSAHKKGFFTGGQLASGHTDRDGAVELSLAVSSSDQIEIYAKGALRYQGYPTAGIKVVV